ncbi:DUF4381 domain-containing protein [Azospirillum argentinense]|uniref:DUF4381 domain-containing protein n=1 Tax=Azospirillum brasilense TaxID=192 RepID=A0A4D8Q2C9_AZOBR|nr:DUF4381 domain-containing protein [Azospirillum argentinense]QCO04574.1 DUF4381 domain-containing protein [Azospirillum argentinense]
MSDDPASLSNLRDLALPDPVPWWPPAPGWWILAAGILLAGLLLAVHAFARYRANAYRREALRALDTLEGDIGKADTALLAQRMASLLKRAALAAYPRSEVASLNGALWLSFLDRTAGTDRFTTGAARRLPDIAYGTGAEGGTDALREIAAAARLWLRTHRAPASGGSGWLC